MFERFYVPIILARFEYHILLQEGEFEEGAKLKIYVLGPDGKEVEVPPHMMRIVEYEEITWGGGIRSIFYGVHSFIVESGSNGKTVLKLMKISQALQLDLQIYLPV